MPDYSLKNKISVTKDFLEEMTSKSWQEIESLKSQISSIAGATEQDKALVQLLDTLLTNYYVFTGCLENLITDFDNMPSNSCEPIAIENIPIEVEPAVLTKSSNEVVEPAISDEIEDFEPFEYFVDFDEPVGEKLTDEDLYQI